MNHRSALFGGCNPSPLSSSSSPLLGQSQGPLGTWVNHQRQAYKKGKLSEERVRKLEDLGFVWNPKSTQPTWDERLGELRKYKSEHGDCNPKRHGSLGEWVKNLRKRKGKLSDERVQKLDDLGFVWDARSTPWDERVNELTKYKSNHGDCNVPESQGSLGIWVANQRQRKGKLSEERVRKLDALGFSWGRETIPKSKRRPTRGSKSRSDAGEAGEGEEGGDKERKRRNTAVAAASAPALPEECVSNAAECDGETDSEIDTKPLKPEDVLIKAETDDESSFNG